MPRADQNGDIYPAGDQPPEPEEDKNKSGQGHADENKQGKGQDDKGQKQEGSQGDQGDQGNQGDDWETRYKNLEKKLGEQGNEMGQLKKQNQELVQQLEQMQAGDQDKQKGEQQAPDYEGKMNDIYKQLDNGDISVEEALRQSNSLTAEMAKQNADQLATEKVQKALEEKDQEAKVQEFFKQHPDFEQLREAGTLEEVKNQMPGFHDDFSAYFAYKAQQAEQQGYEKGKSEMQQLAEGEAGTEKVLQKPGSAIRNQNPEPLTDEGDIKKSMYQRLQEARKSG